jgi:hypothetical protein
MLQCIVIDFFLNNQLDALIIPILFCYKTLHVPGIFSDHHQEFSAVHLALVNFMLVYDDSFQAEPGLCLEAVIKACMKLTSAGCTVKNLCWWAEKIYETCRVL